jgi:hypothetical protein
VTAPTLDLLLSTTQRELPIDDGILPTFLYPSNVKVDQLNTSELEKLTTEMIIFPSNERKSSTCP